MLLTTICQIGKSPVKKSFQALLQKERALYEGLSTELKQGLNLIGFSPLEKQHIDGLCNLSIQMVKMFG
ncbi:hypothetical protein SAMN02982927_00912 [Sporolactobacillus nakayamae]|uniref:Uncharacterized protein n=1 Tax=Sporolactobacillus nakayamae TaxID=269670 RepID=A0A1I2PNI7_9BACL|nr:hypothetical protein SAMN02982927_00912 [Sporolactobacillus nakayamae]